MTEDMEKLAQLQSQAEETGSQLAALQQQLSERENTLAQTEKNYSAAWLNWQRLEIS